MPQRNRRSTIMFLDAFKNARRGTPKPVRNFLIVALYYIVACLFFCNVEGWSILKTVYFTTVTITTVGYGDVAPATVLGKVFGIFFILFGLSVIFSIIAGVALDMISAAEERALAAADDDPTDNKSPHVAKIALSVSMLAFCVFTGAVFFYATGEFDGKFLDCFWWSFVTLTTVGYGDLGFNEESRFSSRIFSIFFILASVLVASVAIGNISTVFTEIQREKKEAALLERLDFNMLIEMDKDGDGIDANEYVIGMLNALEVVDTDKVAMLRAQFADHDRDGSGRLDRNDLAMIALEQERNNHRRALMLKGHRGELLARLMAEFDRERAVRRSRLKPESPPSGGGGASDGARRSASATPAHAAPANGDDRRIKVYPAPAVAADELRAPAALPPLRTVGGPPASVAPLAAPPADADGDAWQRKGVWDGFYDGSFAPHRAAPSATPDDAIARLPWRSGAPTSHLVAYLRGRPRSETSHARALDVGCGTGENLVALAERFAFVVGVDIAARACDAAREAAGAARAAGGARGGGAQVVCADVLAIGAANAGPTALQSLLPLLDDGGSWRFDFVFDCHTYDCVRMLGASEAARAYAALVAPGGTLLVVTGNSDETDERGPVRLSREEVETAFVEAGLRLEVLEATHFDDTDAYRAQPHKKPPLAWISRWRKEAVAVGGKSRK